MGMLVERVEEAGKFNAKRMIRLEESLGCYIKAY